VLEAARVRRTALALALGAVACAGSTVRRDERSSAEHGSNALALRWRTAIHDHGLFEPRPEECATGTVVGTRLVIGSRKGAVVALDTGDGHVVWSTPVSGSVDSEARHDPLRNQVYVGTDDGSLYALDPSDGRIRWTHKARGAIERPPAVDGDAIYVTTAEDRIFALDATSGRFRWQYERERPEGFTIHGHAGARLHGGRLFTGFSDGFLVALNPGTGEALWTRSLAAASEKYVDVDSTPEIVGDAVVASSFSGGLYAVSASTGDVRWRLALEGAGTASLIGGYLYFSSPREGLGALTRDGQLLWRQGLAAAGELTEPRRAGRYLVFSGARAGLFVVDRQSGRLAQMFNPGRGSCGAMALDEAGGNAYVLVNSGSVYALRLTGP
jgi:outer membrane protein assembly factor BamB